MKEAFNEIETIQGIKRDSEVHFKRLFDQFHQNIYAISLKMGLQIHDAEEVVQDTFLMIWSQRETLDEGKSVAGLIKVISKRLIIKRIQKIAAERNYQAYQSYFNSPSTSSLVTEVLWKEIMDEIEKGIAELPEGKRKVLKLVKNEGLTIKEVAKKLDISERSAENQLYRARKMLKKYLEQRGFEWSHLPDDKY